MTEKKITLYFRDDDPAAVLAYHILMGMGRRKSRTVAALLKSAAASYGVESADDLTLGSLMELSSKISSSAGNKGTGEMPKKARKKREIKEETKEKSPVRAEAPAPEKTEENPVPVMETRVSGGKEEKEEKGAFVNAALADQLAAFY